MHGGKIDVVSAIVERGERFLFGKRSPHKRAAPGYWCPISGRLEPGEAQAEAVVREVFEETGLRVRALAKVDECDTHDGSALIHWWRVELLDEAPAVLANDEHSELAWVTLDEMKRLDPVFLEDVAIIEREARRVAASGVAVAYDRWAESYDRAPNPTRVLSAEALRRAPLELAGRRVVEIGCGTGQNSAWLVERAASLVGLDFSEGMLARARAAAPSARFLRHDIQTPWPLEGASADVVIGMLVLEHVQALPPVFCEAARVLAPGGALFVCELHPARQMLGKGARFATGPGGAVEHVTGFPHDVEEYVNAAIDAGFRLERLGEWRDPGAPFEVPPRVLSMLLRASP